MEKARILEKLISETGMSKRAFAEKCGLSESTLYSILKRGVGGASVNIVISICKELGITVEELDEMASEMCIRDRSSAVSAPGKPPAGWKMSASDIPRQGS